MDPNQQQQPSVPQSGAGQQQASPQSAQPAPGQLPNNGFPPSHNPYDFITSPAPTPKKSLLGPANSMRTRLTAVLGGGLVLILLVVIGSSLLNKSSTGNVAALQELLAEQQEIVRIATIGTTQGQTTSARNFYTTALQSTTSDKYKLTTYLTSKKVKTTPVQLASKKDTATDKKLEAAKQSGEFDTVLTATLVSLLSTYKTDAAAAYKNASNSTSKGILETSYKSANILVKTYGTPTAN